MHDEGPLKLQVHGGLLSWKTTTLQLAFRVDISSLGEIHIAFDPISSIQNDSWADHWSVWHDLNQTENRLVPVFHLSGCTSNGIRVHTEYAHLQGLSHTSTATETQLNPQAAASELNLDYSPPEDLACREISVLYLFRAQLGFRHQPVTTSLGELNVAGMSSFEGYTDKFGAIAIRKSGDLNLEEWLEACDDLVDRVRQILSLAQGRWLQWTVREVHAGDAFLSRRFRPRDLQLEALPVLFHHLNPKPIVDIAVLSYTKDLIRQTGLDVALSWMLSPETHVEKTFLNLMIALEHLVSAFESKAKGVIDRETFKSGVSPKLSRAVGELTASGVLSEEQGEIINRRLHSLNSPVFYDRVRQLLEYYHVPTHDLDQDLRFIVVDCRNDLVHRGLLQRIDGDSQRMHQSADIADELLKRIVMAMLGYRGQYISAMYNLDTYVFGIAGVEPLNRRPSP